jgi:hypothetical protein
MLFRGQWVLTTTNHPQDRLDEAGWHVDNRPGVPFGWFGYDYIHFSNVLPPITSGLPMPGLVPLSFATTFALLTEHGLPNQFGSVYPYYRGELGGAELRDGVTPNGADRKMYFITCAACRSGNDTGTIYGCITWGVETNAQGQVSVMGQPRFVNWPPPEFFSAVKTWNQAEGTYELPSFISPVPLTPPQRGGYALA